MSAKAWWCLHCERGFLSDQERPGCAYPDCDGSPVFDVSAWHSLAEMWGYPSEPEWGKIYPQYGFPDS